MPFIAFLLGLLCCIAVVFDAFQTIILPRRASGRFRLTRLFFIATWAPWKHLTARLPNAKIREQVYSFFGPVSLLLLLIVWATVLIIGFALFFFSLHSPFVDNMATQDLTYLARFRTDLYVSGTTLFTLGLGDVLPRSLLARALIIFEAGTGLGFVALVIGYIPVLYGAFSKREIPISMLDARAGSPPSAIELIRRHTFEGGEQALIDLLAEWEHWSAELLESHISYPVLCYYRSQHDNQNWIAALTAILDTCALIISSTPRSSSRQAQLTFSMGRHALIDLALVFHLGDEQKWLSQSKQQRLPQDAFLQLCGILHDSHIQLCGDPDAFSRLESMRNLYERQSCAMAAFLALPLPNWVVPPKKSSSWQTINKLRTEAETALHPHSQAESPQAPRLHAPPAIDHHEALYLHSSDDHGF